MPILLQIDISPRHRLRIFADVVHQIVKHAPQMPVVCLNVNAIFRLFHLQLNLVCHQLFLKFAYGLHEHDTGIAFFHYDTEVSRGCLGRFHEVFNQLF